MISLPLEDYTGVLEAGIGLALKQADVCSRTSRGGFFNEGDNLFSYQPEFQTVRPRTDLVYFYTGGRGRYFQIPGVQPQPGVTPDCAHTGVLSVALITEADYEKHSIYIGVIRRQFNTLIPRLNVIYGGSYAGRLFTAGIYSVQTIIPEATDPKIATDKGQMISTLKYKIDFGVDQQYDPDTGQFVEQTVNINDEN